MNIKNVDLFFSENPNPMWIYDPADLSIKEVNQSALDLYGYTRSEMLSLSIKDLRPQSEVPELLDFVSEKTANDFINAGTWRHQKKNGEPLFVRILSSPVEIDGEIQKLVVAQDVTSKIIYKSKYQMLFENSLDGFMLMNPDGDILEVNNAACQMLGMNKEEIIQGGIYVLVVNNEQLKNSSKEQSETGKFSGELTFKHTSGRTVPVELTTSEFSDSLGNQRTSVVFRDISHRKEAEEALQEEKKFTEIAVNSLPGVFFVLNEKGEVIKWNDNSTSVFGLTHKEIENRPAVDFVHQDDKQLIEKEVARVFAEGHTKVELKLITANNTVSIYRFVANRFRQNNRTYIVGSGINITEKKELEKKLNTLLKQEHTDRKKAEEDRDHLRGMFEKAPSPKCVLEGPDLRFTIANDSCRQIIGNQDIIGKKITDVIPETNEQVYIDLLKKVYRTGKPYLGKEKKVKIKKKNQGEREDYVFNILFEPLSDDKGNVYGIFAEGIDLSEQIEYRNKLEESLKEKDTLLSEIHHRVKNNLAIICSLLELQTENSNNPVLEDALRSSQQRILTIASIHELLYTSQSFSSINFGEEIHKLVNNLHDLYKGKKEITTGIQADNISLNINQAIPCALIITEVVTNAFKHAFNNRDNGKVSITVSNNSGIVTIEIVDNGAGFKGALNYTDSHSLGLTLVNLLAQQLDGQATFTTKNGTRFRLIFEKANFRGSSSSIIDG